MNTYTAMKIRVIVLGLVALFPVASLAQQQPSQPGWPQPMKNNRSFGLAMLDQNELRVGNGSYTYRWDGEARYGDNLNRAWLRTEGNLDADTGTLEEGEVQGLYSRVITRFFDLQGGVRYDFKPGPSRAWAVVGVEGLAPLFWDVGVFAFISTGGHAAARVEGLYNLQVTQRLVLQPQLELNFYAKSDSTRETGAGLSDFDVGLRLRYEIRREFAPYVGVTWERKFGRTADFARQDNASVGEVRLAAGIRVWL